ncbi:MAG TPA: peptidylprolyl isomerase [Phenylobacterium sp.]|uniref:peptidylprolyl isomerase n=1 Tax=Phenylobacterium sp. TaxID=1871053 RepID=UPI002C940B7C|nr:peptidylprolyl isomerase [Phenylobacterium sp.]HSV04204.1 peptidylprolyl isomerase [Phenylobacterium sp.]
MKTALIAVAALAGLATAAMAAPKARPAASPATPAAPGPADWRIPDPNDVLVIDTNKGRILVEMIPEVAPQTVARIRELTRAHFYDGLRFFRVIDDFMAQTGDPQNNGTGGSDKPNVPGEFTFRRGAETPFVLVADQTVAEVGFIKSLPVTSQSMSLAAMTKDQKVAGWALYCPGVAGMARDENPDSNNSQFFLMRRSHHNLEKRYTAFGRVIAGEDVVRAIKTGEPVEPPQDRMERVRLLADLPTAERPKIRVIDPRSAWFKAQAARAEQASPNDFMCDLEIPAEVK